MTGIVITGKTSPGQLKELNKYDGLVIYLMKGGYDNESLNILEKLYRETIVNLSLENLKHLCDFLEKFGLKDKIGLLNIWITSEFSFFKFIELLSEKFNIVVENLKLFTMSNWLIELFEKFKTRKGSTVIVGEINDIPKFNIKSYFNDNNNITVVNDVSFVCSKLEPNCSFIAIDGAMLTNHFDLNTTDENMLILISKLTNGYFIPNSLIKKRVIMTQDIVDGPYCLEEGKYIQIDF